MSVQECGSLLTSVASFVIKCEAIQWKALAIDYPAHFFDKNLCAR